ncbi:MAG: hypothetical protein U1D30_15465 [Planctomycetota bacterium]
MTARSPKRENLKLGDIKKRGAEIKEGHDLAMAARSTQGNITPVYSRHSSSTKLLSDDIDQQRRPTLFAMMTRKNAHNWLTGFWQTSSPKTKTCFPHGDVEKNPLILRRLF